ncbi:hypothetical protein FOL47_004382 [Perkinsus chesapeaki]|uniref:TIR domain-containing protein n=1 Tax=Perkinsus chesapeaki TaxID=330153 RepID=A0A7J6MZ67_PERCH|nr:hypothetical protein FOL47_004382 [Perkinsus chesapeaki]
MVFLDKCCINQTDLVDKANGISKLSDYLKKSDKLVILWTPNYLNRLWCVYELAVFMQTHETKDVIVVNLGHVRLCVSLLAVQLLGTIAQCPSIRLAGESVQYIIMSCTICGAFVSCMLGASQAHRCLEEWTTFLMKLESFDVNGAECTLYEDHNKLKQLIRKMYRSEADFSALVKRLFLREEEHERSLAWFLSQSSRRIMSAPFVPAIAAGAASAFSLVFLEQSRPLTRIVPEGSVWEMPSTLATLAWAIRTHLLPELLLPFRVQLTLSLTHKLAGQRLGLRSRSLFRIQFTIAFVAFSLLNRASCGLGVFHIPLSEATVKGLSDEVLSLSAGLIALSSSDPDQPLDRAPDPPQGSDIGSMALYVVIHGDPVTGPFGTVTLFALCDPDPSRELPAAGTNIEMELAGIGLGLYEPWTRIPSICPVESDEDCIP